jgi:hypothetical protein
MKITEVMMTPELAKVYLERNTHNRPLNKNHVKFISREMKAGRWKRNGDTVCMNGTRLIDGQHRLHGIVDSGVTVPILLVEGLDDDVFDTKDFGKKRSAADVLAIKGEKHYALLAAAVVFVDRYMTGQIEQAKRTYSPVEVEELVAKYGDDLRVSVDFCSKLGTKRLVANSVMAGLHYVFAKFDKEQSDGFWKSLIGGHGLDEESPVFVLRERLVSNSMAKGKLKPEYVAALCIRAWNHMRAGTTVKCLKYQESGRGTHAFPMAR